MAKKQKLFCPKCGGRNVANNGDKGEFGEIFVAEEIDRDIECYDIITAYNCDDCGCVWYISTEEM